jgi:hypothetical protein
MTHAPNLPSRLLIVLLLLVTLGVPAAHAKQGDTFGDNDLRGDYGFAFDGVLFLEGQPVPIAASGQFEADGKGTFPNFVRYVNVGGGLVLRQEGFGTYTINPDGTASAEFTVITVEPPDAFPDTTETFTFTLAGNRRKVQFISTTPGSVAMGLAIKQ